jgi:SAM-dependent methyltransferase
MSDKLEDIKRVYNEEGIINLSGKILRYIGEDLIEGQESDRKKEVINNYTDGKKYLNVGGGNFIRENWRVLDYYSEHYDYDDILIDYQQDLEECKTWEIEDNSFDLVYSSATLEHLSSSTVEHTLSEAYRILKPGGGIHITVPDADLLLNIYENRDIEWIEKVHSFKIGEPGYISCQEKYKPEFYLLRRIATSFIRIKTDADVNFEDVQSKYEYLNRVEFLNYYTNMVKDEWHREHPGGHRNWFNENKLNQLLTNTGFSEAKRTYTRQSRFTELCKEGFDTRPQWSVHVEAIKPQDD